MFALEKEFFDKRTLVVQLVKMNTLLRGTEKQQSKKMVMIVLEYSKVVVSIILVHFSPKSGSR